MNFYLVCNFVGIKRSEVKPFCHKLRFERSRFVSKSATKFTLTTNAVYERRFTISPHEKTSLKLVTIFIHSNDLIKNLKHQNIPNNISKHIHSPEILQH